MRLCLLNVTSSAARVAAGYAACVWRQNSRSCCGDRVDVVMLPRGVQSVRSIREVQPFQSVIKV